MDESTILLELNCITKSFPGVLALDNIRFDLRPGEVHVLVGENGAGKSTLVKILSGVYQPDTGEIKILGDKVHIPNSSIARKMGISVIHQELTLIPHLTVAENMFLGREPSKRIIPVLDRKLMGEETEKVLEKIGIKADPHEKVENLSLSTRQMLEIAHAVMYGSKILIMDEPTSTLSQKEVEVLFKVIKDIKKTGTAIIYISHRLEEIFKIGDRVTIFRDGCYIDTLPINELDQERLIQLMVGRSITEKYPRRLGEYQAADSEVVVKVNNLSVSGILHNISFDLRKGEVLGIAGMVGSGRSELALTLYGGLGPYTGSIIIKGKEANIACPADAISLGLALAPEDRKKQGLITILSLKDNITLPVLDEISRGPFVIFKRMKEITADLVNRLGIKTPSLETPVRNLSGGNQQKVVFAKCTTTSPAVLILDEPTRGIDVGAKTEVYTLMNKYISQGNSIIMISSELAEILGMADRIMVMREGRVAGFFNRANATQESVIKCALAG